MATATSASVSNLKQSDAVLLILDALQCNGRPVDRILLEGIASIARSPAYKSRGCRILSVFDTHYWQRRLYESLAHLEQTDCVRSSFEGYELTDRGMSRLDSIDRIDGEADDIRRVARRVRQILGRYPFASR